MEAIFINNNSIDEFANTFRKLDERCTTLLILSADDNNYNKCVIDSLLINAKSKIMGGIFPQIIYEKKNYSIGTVICVLDDIIDVTVIQDLSMNNNISDFIEDNIIVDTKTTNTIFVLVDGLSKNIGSVINGLFENFGLFVNYIGGGAGSLTFIQKPVIYTNEGLLEDCAQIGITKLRSSIGVKHGWEAISNPFKVTKSSKNIVLELDYKPAFEVYKEVVEFNSHLKFNNTNFFDIAKGYPLGINKLSGEMIVRDPIMTQNNALICVGDVAENVFVSILKGEDENLINSAKKANEEAKESVDFDSFTLFIDCISRVLFLNDKFSDELEQVYDKNIITFGALTLGEIANNKNHYLEFYNKTAVVAKIEKTK